jgi:BioD-like phosphotransacetylase family protein
LDALFIVSVEQGAGKTAICAGLAINILNSGKTVGYAGKEGDIAFMGRVVGVADAAGAPGAIKDKNIILVESTLGPRVEDTKQAITAVKDMKAKVIAVEAYSGQPSKNLEIYKWFEKSLLGVVLNRVPDSQLKSVKDKATAQFGAAGIKMLGAIPESRTLLAITVGELADIVKGKILNNPEKSGELVENYMLGAMVVGSGALYFERKGNKAAIIHQDRPDMQLAALETPTRCLILTGSPDKSGPIANVSQKAASRGIPVIATEANTPDIIAMIEEAILKNRLHEDKKLASLGELVKQGLELKAVM